MKRVVDASMAGIDPALTTESAALADLVAAGTHQEPMAQFLAAGGQTRAVERGSLESILTQLRDPT